MKSILLTAAGVGLLMLTAYDVYATVLNTRARYGPVGERLNRHVWRATRWAAFRLPRPRRHRLLNAVGPLLLPLLLVTYITLIVLGFALVYAPRMPAQFHIGDLKGRLDFLDALYFSGITLTTLGYGEIVPASTMMRLAALVESASGIALISLAIAYLLAVYGALANKRTAALTLYHQAGEGADAAGFIAHHFVEGRFYGLREALRTATRDLQGVLESHVEHPVIHYFHPPEVYKSLPRMLFLLLEACAVIRTALDDERHSDVRNHPEVRTLEASARYVLGELVDSLDLERRRRRRTDLPEEAEEDERRWRGRFAQTLDRLAADGVETRRDREAGYREYRARRRDWESKLRRLSLHLGYDWEEVTGDLDLDYAADEQKEEPAAKAGDVKTAGKRSEARP
ncbi:MAG TPA: potassium channel family protein [Pyrinomonadaceae bacterium]|nr:potassium channel family protein [Pyrinomonadaceae bacterium]